MDNNCRNSVRLFADIGNSTIDFLALEETDVKRAKIDTHDKKAVLAYLETYRSCKRLSLRISSVNSTGLSFIREFLKTYEGEKDVFLLTPENRKAYASSHHRKVDNLSFLGSDLFCDIIAEENLNGEIIIDLGTASKILYLSKENTFYGASIFPGLASFAKTLNRTTDQLERISLRQKPQLVSLKTEECISSGTINGGASLIAGRVKQIKEEYSCPSADVYLTGGNAYLVKDILPEFGLKDFIDNPYHIRKGLMQISDKESLTLLNKRRKKQ